MKGLGTKVVGGILFVVLVIVVALFTANRGAGDGTATSADPDALPTADPEVSQAVVIDMSITDGPTLFRTFCAKCHGLKGLGDGPSVGSLRSQGGMNLTILQDRSDEEIFNTITAGKGSEMPPWGLILSEEQRWELVKYIRTLGSE